MTSALAPTPTVGYYGPSESSTTETKENEVQITIDTNNLSELDIAMLAFLAGNTEAEEEVAGTPADEETAEPEPEKPKAAAKKAAAKKAEPEEDLVGGDGPTMSDAVAAATQLVSEGGAARVKAALAVVGAKRVSEMDESDIPAFLAALEEGE